MIELMHFKRISVVLLLLLVLLAPGLVRADAFCGSGSTCPNGDTWENLYVVESCTVASDHSYCIENPDISVRNGSGTCVGFYSGGNPAGCQINGVQKFNTKHCNPPTSTTNPNYPYEVQYSCASSLVTEKVVVDCCPASSLAGCQGSCSASADCKDSLTCSGGKCVNSSCASDADCECDAGPTDPTCAVTLTGPATVEAGDPDGYEYTVTTTKTGTGAISTPALSAPGFGWQGGSSSYS